jgi:hypothetical protein
MGQILERPLLARPATFAGPSQTDPFQSLVYPQSGHMNLQKLNVNESSWPAF